MTDTLPVTLVTGGARRIGRAIAMDLAEHGYPVVVHCFHSRGEADALVDEIADKGGRAASIVADLSDANALESVFDQARSAFGSIGMLINNASLFESDEAEDFDWSTWDAHFALHTKAPVELARLFAKQLTPAADGLIVNLIDQRVWRPTPRFFSYTLSKSALWTATQTLAQALAPQVRVNAIGPGPTLPNSRQDESAFQSQVSALLLRRGPDLSEFGATIRYFWSARSVTGQMIALDGGQHLAWQTPDVAGIAE